MVRLIKGSHASSSGTDLRGLTSASADQGRMSCFPVLARVVRLQISNVSARNRCTTGVQSPPKLPQMVDHIERGKVTSPPGANPGRHYRKACCWRGDNENVGQSKGDSVMGSIERKLSSTLNTKASVSVEQSAHVQHGVSLRENLENL
jgi:hypothetical protein